MLHRTSGAVVFRKGSQAPQSMAMAPSNGPDLANEWPGEPTGQPLYSLLLSVCVISYFSKHAFLLSLSGDWLTGEERGELQRNIQEPPTGNFPEDKGSQQQSEYWWEKDVLGQKVDKAEAPWDTAGQHREFLWPFVCDLMLLGFQGSGPTRMSPQRTDSARANMHRASYAQSCLLWTWWVKTGLTSQRLRPEGSWTMPWRDWKFAAVCHELRWDSWPPEERILIRGQRRAWSLKAFV